MTNGVIAAIELLTAIVLAVVLPLLLRLLLKVILKRNVGYIRCFLVVLVYSVVASGIVSYFESVP